MTQGRYLLLAAGFLALLAVNASAAILYVDVNSASPTPPYTNWVTAAVTIQDAVDAAEAGDEIVVTNGVYQTGGRVVNGVTTNRVAVTKPLVLRSVNGPEVTVIRGYQVPVTTNGLSAVRCVYLIDGVMLAGFTLTNGATQSGCCDNGGGGVFCASASAVVSNCVLSVNSADWGGGAHGATLINCVIGGNSAAQYGGGAHLSILNNCTLRSNSAARSGGGASFGTLNSCVLTSNSAAGVLRYDGGGGAYDSALNNCLLNGNRTDQEGGGARDSTLNNCLLTGNSASRGGGALYSTLNNCTIIGNSASISGGGAGSSSSTMLNNCIVHYNAAPNGANYDSIGTILNYCCTTPTPINGIGTITNAPLFVDANDWSNLRLQSSSPCINSGLNSSAPSGPDLDGNPRIAGGTVDMGAFELQSPASVISYAWLQGYSLPTDGSVDYSDSDVDHLNNWQEWIAGTNPTNSLSVLRLLNPTNNVSGVSVSWESVTGRNYFLERGTDLGEQAPFLLLKTNIIGQASATSYTDTNAIGDGPFFYRVGVQQ